jgi:uncharacterized membrane protein YecN with MAPEG domain
MAWIELVSLIALLQYLVFGALVGQARVKYGVKAPSTTGHEMFERVYRVQMNTLELLVVFLPALWMAARYLSPVWVAAVGAVYVLGRVVYYRAYAREPRTRSLGYMLSAGPVAVLLAVVGVGLVRGVLGL